MRATSRTVRVSAQAATAADSAADPIPENPTTEQYVREFQ